jgi:hypothetical protein
MALKYAQNDQNIPNGLEIHQIVTIQVFEKYQMWHFWYGAIQPGNPDCADSISQGSLK